MEVWKGAGVEAWREGKQGHRVAARSRGEGVEGRRRRWTGPVWTLWGAR